MSVECCSTAPFDASRSPRSRRQSALRLMARSRKASPKGAAVAHYSVTDFLPRNDRRDDVRSHEIRADFSEGIYPCRRPFLNGGNDNDDGDAR